MPIYTRTGDKGKTSLFDGKRVFKSDRRVNTYGTIDELNSAIGLVISELQSTKGKVQKDTTQIKRELERIQHDLFVIGASLANTSSTPLKGFEKRASAFEEQIDEMTKKMPPLKNFILPGGGKTGSFLHVARTVCRRAERLLVGLLQKEQIDEHAVKYINRLSDLLFTMARYVNHIEKKKEIVWVNPV